MKKRLPGRRLILMLCMTAALGLFTAAALADTEVSTWAELQAAFNEGSSVMLTRTISAASDDGPLVVPLGKTVILDLAGKDVDRGLKDNLEDGYVIRNEKVR